MSPSILLGRRTRAMRLVLVLVFGAMILRLIQVQDFGHQRYASASVAELSQPVTVPAIRGGIYDRNGEVLAESVTKPTVVGDPMLIHKLGTLNSDVDRLAPILGVPRQQLWSELSGSSGFVYLAHRVSGRVAKKVSALQLGGINLISESQRIEPDGQLALPVVGTTGWNGNGTSGLEYQYQTLLAGRPGLENLLVAPDGVALPGSSAGSVAAKPGSGLELTIDDSIQYVAEQALATEIVASHAFSGTAIVEDVKTGQILAMANLQATSGSATTGSTGAPAASTPAATPTPPPTTSGPNLMASTETLPAGVEQAPSNSALTQVYEPGSVFKLVTFSAALAGGLITPSQMISVPASLRMGTYTFHDAESHGTVDMSASQILAQSSNLGTIEIAQRLGENPLLAQIADLGFGSPTGLDFPGESSGIVPGASNWTGTSIGSTPIGQDDAVTAQQVLDAYNAVADGGVFVAPSLIRGTISPSGATTLVKKPATRRVISPAVDAELVPMLEGVVQSGTGTEAAIDGYTVAGKTGTAQIPNPNKPGYISGAYMGSFAGFAPAQSPVLSAIVVLDHPTPIYGGAVAAPVFSTIMAYALHHYGIPTTAAGTTAASNSAVGGTGSISVPAGATTEGP